MNPELLLTHFDRISDAPDAIPRLRLFVLDLAVRGKLVEQDPNDEPASELLKRIQLEKARLQNDGEIGPQKPVPEIRDEELPFLAPSAWSWARLAAISRRIHYGFTASANPSLKDVRLLRITDIQNNLVDWSSVPGCEIAEREVIQYKLQQGDILIARTGGTIGKTFLVNQMPVTAVFASYLIRVQKSSEFYDRYLKLFLESPVYWKQLQEGSRGGGQPNVNGQTLGKMVVAVPPLAEQHRIVAKADELMALCDRLEVEQRERETRRDSLSAASLHHLNNCANAEALRGYARFCLGHLSRLTTRPVHIQQLRQTILNLAVRGQLAPQDPNDEPASKLLQRIHDWRKQAEGTKHVRAPRKSLQAIGETKPPYQLPNGWQWARLGELIYIHSGDGLTAEAMEDGCIPVFGGNGIAGYHDTPNISQPSIVIGRVGYYCGSIHVTPAQAWVTDNAFITEFPSDEILLSFLVLLLRATNLKENEKATAQPVISGSKVYPIVVGLPPFAEQHRIVAKVNELMRLCDQLEARLNAAQTETSQLLESVLHHALNDSLQGLHHREVRLAIPQGAT